jgi:heme ABC exporter ATP-binding subunit CcmA
MDPVIHLRGAVALLGRFPALAGVDLTVDAGQLVVLQGPNGAGKSTLLRLCAGLLPLANGHGTVLGHDLRSERRSVRAHVGLLGHDLGLYEELSVEDNLRFWARAAGLPAGSAADAAQLLGLDGRLRDVQVARLSAGQRRRTALAVLAARRPELWLLDEPHAGLDRAGRDVLDGLLRSAVTAGATVLLASHEHERVAGLRARVVDLSAGSVVPAGRDGAAPPGLGAEEWGDDGA